MGSPADAANPTWPADPSSVSIRLLLAAVSIAVVTAGCIQQPQSASTGAAAQPTVVVVPPPPTAAKPTSCSSRGGLPDPLCTPGATDPRVTQANIASTICTRGYTATVRPPVDVTEPIKRKEMAVYGLQGQRLAEHPGVRRGIALGHRLAHALVHPLVGVQYVYASRGPE